jgi:hypothetical protein
MPNGWRVVGKGFWIIFLIRMVFLKQGGTFGGNTASRKQTTLFAAVQEKMP